jgi:hypothetical protein
MRYHHASISGAMMRTTLDIADDVLFAAKEVAKREKKPLGTIISELARKAFAESFTPIQTAPDESASTNWLTSYGIVPLPSRGGLVTNEMVNRLREQEGI